MKKFLKYVVTFIVLLIIFNVLLFLSSLFPSSLIEDNVKKSSEILLREGNAPKIYSYLYQTNNNYTDSIIINSCYSIDNTDPIFSYMSVRKNYKKGLTTKELLDKNGELVSYTSEGEEDHYNPVHELNEFLNSRVTTSVEYARYWHGNLVFIRPLLLIFNIQGIRLFLLFVFVILFAIFFKLLCKKIGIINTIMICFSLLAYDYLFVSCSLESAPIFLVMMISSIILLLRIDKIKNIQFYLFIVACISNFVDFLTVPTITLTIPLFIYILYKQKNEHIDLKEAIKTIIISSILWGIGYSFTWIAKWIIYDFIYDKALLASAIAQVIHRTKSYNLIKSETTIWKVLFKLFAGKFIYFIFIISIEFSILICLKFSKYNKINFVLNKKIIKEIIPILIISMIPVVWYIALSNHTILHIHFIYRHMVVVLMGELLCINKLFKKCDNKELKKVK